jgi:hypothetical protein
VLGLPSQKQLNWRSFCKMGRQQGSNPCEITTSFLCLSCSIGDIPGAESLWSWLSILSLFFLVQAWWFWHHTVLIVSCTILHSYWPAHLVVLANIISESSHCFRKGNRNPGHRLCIMVCPSFWEDYYMLIYTHCWELMNSVGSHSSSSLPSMMNAVCDEGAGLSLCLRLSWGYDCTHCCVTFNCCCGDFSATLSLQFVMKVMVCHFVSLSWGYDWTHCHVTFNCCCGDFSATSSISI